MAKSREEDGGEAQAPEANGDGGHRRAGGRTIARWKAKAHDDLPTEASDVDVATAINRLAREEGADYACTAAQVAKWREAGTWPPAEHAPETAPAPEGEGHGIVVLRQLVYLLGKDGVKKLIDSL